MDRRPARWHHQFSPRYPPFAISIALESVEGHDRHGVIYRNPANEELFVAERGKGAFLNEQRLRVAAPGGSSRKQSSPAGCRTLHRGDLALFRREFAVVQEEVAGLRRFGAASLDLAWVAAGPSTPSGSAIFRHVGHGRKPSPPDGA
ncbi:MAG: inositol monophosphatase family protein [Xanthobacteraceae bacterium]